MPESINNSLEINNLGLCPHGNLLGSVCEACFEASKVSQSVWETIQSLEKRSKYERIPGGPVSRLRNLETNAEFSIEPLEQPSSIIEMQNFLEQHFKPKELLSPEVFLKRFSNDLPNRYRGYAIKKEGSIVSGSVGTYLKVGDGIENNLLIGMGLWTATDSQMTKTGLAREAYISMLMQGAMLAEMNQANYVFNIGESTNASEQAWNAMGRKRIYQQTGEGEVFEVEYFQPALNFDLETGRVSANSGEIREHLIIHPFAKQDVSLEDIENFVKSILASSVWRRNEFSSDQAYEKHQEYLRSWKDIFLKQFNSKNKIILLSANERNKMIEGGISVHESAE
jgi:hypothetical protein